MRDSNSKTTTKARSASNPTPDEMVDRATELVPLLIEEQAATEARTFYSEGTHEAFIEAGFYRMLVPRRCGGLEFDLETFYRVMTVIATGCPSTAWQLSFGASQAKVVGSMFDLKTQAEIFGDGHFISPMRPLPTGQARRADDGGWIVNATFNYCSGAPYATHFTGITVHPRPDGSMGLLFFVAPRSAWTRLDDWGSAIGLKGSGSHSVRFDSGYVPRQFAIPMSDIQDLLAVPFDPPGARLHGDSAIFYGPISSFVALQPAALTLGMVKGALSLYEEYLTTKSTFLPPITLRCENPDYQLWFGSALAKVATAEAALLNMCQQWMHAAQRHMTGDEPFSEATNSRLTALAFEIANITWDVMENYCLRTAGTSAFRDGERMQRIFRDMCAVRSHGYHLRTNTTFRDLASHTLAGHGRSPKPDLSQR